MEEMKTFIKARGRWKTTITRIYGYAENPAQDADVFTIDTKLETLSNAWNEFVKSGDELAKYDKLEASDTEIAYLSPAHFLIGRTYTAVPEDSYLQIPTNRLSYWQHVQAMLQGFWKRWHQEYLTSLQQRPKWTTKLPNIAIGNLVLIKDSNAPPSAWLLGRGPNKTSTSEDNIKLWRYMENNDESDLEGSSEADNFQDDRM
ncbi:uncharacterized protein LOC124461016 [Drosophila willistoni]|uniref:uncharacterized protein LOC124461016 n=1 Tax=Drosophila willistoni TaxID=7260 RepID=UPI001F076EE1|nr:uncharacterized protein LOC124461016 [Drosophila willistoni]